MRWFARDTIVVTLLAITFGTNLFHYATYNAVFSHSFSFFLCALRDLARPPGSTTGLHSSWPQRSDWVPGLITVARPAMPSSSWSSSR